MNPYTLLAIPAAVAKLVFALFELVSGDAPEFERLLSKVQTSKVQTMKLKTLLAILLAIIVIHSVFGHGAAADDARRIAAQRQRRIIFNNDGDDAWLTDAPATPEGFLSVRMDHIGDCGIDTVFYCTTQGINIFTQDSALTEVFLADYGSFANNRMAKLVEQGTDPVELAIQACRKHGIEIIWTMRMNDIHDNWTAAFFSQWKNEHPQFLMGTAADRSKYSDSDPRNVYSFADFAHREVRDLTVEVIKDVLERYDVDGIDLDFLRHTCFFKETRLFEPVTPEHLDMLTDMVAQIRTAVLTASKKKGKPILLTARVFPTLALNRHFGFDVERWVTSGHVDFIAVGGGYDPFTMPAKDMIDRGHAWGIPVYLCTSASGMVQRGVSHSDLSGGSTVAWRATAANAWNAGADGIMTFNLFPQLPGSDATKNARAAWTEMCDPQALVGKDKLYCIENLDHARTLGYMLRSVPWEGRLPVAVAKGESVDRHLPVADDIPALANRIKRLRLRICLTGLAADDQVAVSINGTALAAKPEKPLWLAADVPPAAMKQGKNDVTIGFVSGTAESLEMRSVELTVDYK